MRVIRVASIVTMRVSEETKALWKAAANDSGLSLTAYISMCVDDAQGLPVPSVTPLTESGLVQFIRTNVDSPGVRIVFDAAAKAEGAVVAAPQIAPSRVVSRAKNTKKPTTKVRDRGPEMCEHRRPVGTFCALCAAKG